MKVLFIPTDVSGVIFYRVRQPADALERYKKASAAVLWYQPNFFQAHPWEDSLDQPEFPNVRSTIEAMVSQADVVVWMKLHTTQSLHLFLEMKQQFRKPFLTEIDDYVFDLPATNLASTVYAPGSPLNAIFMRQIQESAGLVVSTPYLKELYTPFKARIDVVENCVNPSLWPRRPPSHAGQRVNIGWMGGGTHNEDLALVKDAIFEVLQKYPKATFTCLHGCPSFFKGHKQVRWTHDFKPIDKYPRWVAKHKFDIGIAPLVDNNFNRGKSNLRYLEYAAQGVPCVASPLPHFAEIIQHGENGLLAHTKEDWVHCLSELIERPELRANMGAAAFNTVKTSWSPKVAAGKYHEILKGYIKPKKENEVAVTDA